MQLSKEKMMVEICRKVGLEYKRDVSVGAFFCRAQTVRAIYRVLFPSCTCDKCMSIEETEELEDK